MSRLTIPATLAALFLSTAAFAGVNDQVMEIKVSTELTAVRDPSAGERVTDVSADIKSALAGMLATRLADKGIKIDIEITQLKLDANSGGPDAGKAIIAGKVHFNDDTDNSKIRAFGLEVSEGPAIAKIVVPGDDSSTGAEVSTNFIVEVAATSPEMAYQSLVDGFAKAVIDHLNE